MAVFAEKLSEFFGPHLLVTPFNNGALVDSNANRNSPVLARINDGFHLTSIADIPRIQTNFVNARFHRFKRSFEMKMHVSNNRNPGSGQDFRESFRVFFLWNGDTNDIGSSGMKSVDFSH